MIPMQYLEVSLLHLDPRIALSDIYTLASGPIKPSTEYA